MENNICVLGRLVGITDNIMSIRANNSQNELGKEQIKVKLSDFMANNLKKSCGKGTLLGVKGRISDDNSVDMIAERISFLSSRERD